MLNVLLWDKMTSSQGLNRSVLRQNQIPYKTGFHFEGTWFRAGALFHWVPSLEDTALLMNASFEGHIFRRYTI